MKQKVKLKPKPKKVTFGAGGNTVNPKFPNTRNSAMNKRVDPKPNTQTMGFNGSIPSR